MVESLRSALTRLASLNKTRASAPTPSAVAVMVEPLRSALVRLTLSKLMEVSATLPSAVAVMVEPFRSALAIFEVDVGVGEITVGSGGDDRAAQVGVGKIGIFKVDLGGN